MGRILDEIAQGHLKSHPRELEFLEPFLALFDVTRGEVQSGMGTSASVYFLKPSTAATEAFGFEREVLLAYSPYSTFEPRLIQLIDRVMSTPPARMRVEPVCWILIHEDPRVRESIGQVATALVQTKAIVPFYRLELSAGADEWFVRRRISENFLARDLFDMTQNLPDDTYYFGRQALVHDLVDRFRKGRNTGLFGLRKTGKTSTISKLSRTLAASELGFVVVLDANDPALYQQRWWQLLGTVAMRIGEATGHVPIKGLEPFRAPDTASEGFAGSLNYVFARLSAPRDRILLVVDEVEHICPELSVAVHWNQDFLPFWQTIRAYQTRRPGFCFMVAGVNPQISERTKIGPFDNPLFSLLPKMFVPSFSRDEVTEMVGTLGRYMGMRFSAAAIDYLQLRYGGHPMLIRLACSWTHKKTASVGKARPVTIKSEDLASSEEERDRSLAPYAQHILDVLTTWYPAEYEMLEMLAAGDVADYRELAAADPQLWEHLEAYGLVQSSQKHATVATGMLADYVRERGLRKGASPTSAIRGGQGRSFGYLEKKSALH